MTMTTEQTPIFDAVIAHVGNPVHTPAVDRSYAAIVALAAAAQVSAEPAKTVPAPAAPRKAVAAAGRKTAS